MMTTYARILAGAIAELFTPPVGVPMSECFNPALVWVDVTSVTPEPKPGWTATETAGAWTFAAPPAPPPPDTRAAAQIALDKSDVTVGRCYEHGVAVPADWVTYRAALRAHVSGGPTTVALPVAPAYPAGT
jgi:hypothetical protein